MASALLQSLCIIDLLILILILTTQCLADTGPSVVYRADMLSPEDLKLQGRFLPRGIDGTRARQTETMPTISLFDHVRGLPSGTSRFDSGYVSTTTSIAFARRFLHTTLGSQGYIYKMHVSPNFIDTAQTLGQFYAQSDESEVSVLGGPLYSQVLSWIEFRQGVEQPETSNPDYDSFKFDEAVWGGVQYQLAGFPEQHVAWKLDPWRRYSDCELVPHLVESCRPRQSSLQFAIHYTELTGFGDDDDDDDSDDSDDKDDDTTAIFERVRIKDDDIQESARRKQNSGLVRERRRMSNGRKHSGFNASDSGSIPSFRPASYKDKTHDPDIVYVSSRLSPQEAKRQRGLLPAKAASNKLPGHVSLTDAARDGRREVMVSSSCRNRQAATFVYAVRATPNMVRSKTSEGAVSVVGGVRWPQVLGWTSVASRDKLQDWKTPSALESNPAYDSRFDDLGGLFHGPDEPDLETASGLTSFMRDNGRSVGWTGSFPLFKPSSSTASRRDYSRVVRARRKSAPAASFKYHQRSPWRAANAWSWIKRNAAPVSPVVDAVQLISPVGDVIEGIEAAAALAEAVDAGDVVKGVMKGLVTSEMKSRLAEAGA
ncbi:putative enterotoxin [Ophiocordyceps camponoti-rufipedis]|uniref:Putative enterotoxin n=1 Tax=Ophiocordyceps camponoti-rufipedis TaxID=2004952 RepID=A0A2C5ZL26_9HYPO|nr:putative enterotoxin [Ophiocordyceps camponoti-rufipedis]